MGLLEFGLSLLFIGDIGGPIPCFWKDLGRGGYFKWGL